MSVIPIHFKNYLDVGLLLVGVFLFGFTSKIALFISAHLIIFMLWYLRYTPRYFDRNARNYISPVDGIVVDINDTATCEAFEGTCKKVSILTRVHDAHFVSSPINGKMESKAISNSATEIDILSFLNNIIKGRNFSLKVPIRYKNTLKTIISNEHHNNKCMIEHSTWHIHGISSIVNSSMIEQGDRISVDHFGAFNVVTNIYLPSNTRLNVMIGQTMIGSETIIAYKSEIGILTIDNNNNIESENQNTVPMQKEAVA